MTLEPPVKPGEEINGFRFDNLIGCGARSFVYEGEQVALQRKVALKVLMPQLATDKAALNSFLKAGRSGSHIVHPTILPIYDIISDGSIHFIVTKHVHAKDLNTLLAEKKMLGLKSLINIALDISLALQCAHENKLFHGNLCPANIFRLSDGKTNISDFCHPPLKEKGFPQDAAHAQRATYVAPEQIRDGKSSVTADIYSFGAVLFAIGTDHQPYVSATQEAMTISQAVPPQPDMREHNKKIIPSFAELVGKMLDSEPKNRPQSAHEVIQELQNIRRDLAHSIQAAKKQQSRQLPPPLKRKYRRLSSNMDVAISPQNPDEHVVDALYEKIRNISDNGAFVSTQNPLPIGSFLNMEFDLEDKPVRLHVFGAVRWHENTKELQGMGVQFLKVSTSDQENLKQYMDDRIVNEMIHTLTCNQTNKLLLKMFRLRWEETFSMAQLISHSGTSLPLIKKALADFEKFGLVVISDEGVKALRPRAEKIARRLEELHL